MRGWSRWHNNVNVLNATELKHGKLDVMYTLPQWKQKWNKTQTNKHTKACQATDLACQMHEELYSGPVISHLNATEKQNRTEARQVDFPTDIFPKAANEYVPERYTQSDFRQSQPFPILFPMAFSLTTICASVISKDAPNFQVTSSPSEKPCKRIYETALCYLLNFWWATREAGAVPSKQWWERENLEWPCLWIFVYSPPHHKRMVA